MHVVISGGGLSALSICNFLSKRLDVKKISLIDSTRKKVYDSQIGLWNPAMDILTRDHALPMNTQHFASVESSGYRNVSGQWIMRPLEGLSIYAASNEDTTTTAKQGKPSLSFLSNKDLLRQMRKLLDKDKRVSLYEKDSILEITNGTITTTKDRQIECDLLIAADGSTSNIARLLTSNGFVPFQQQGNKKSSVDANRIFSISYRGYDVYRGHASLEIPVESFQTWGPGARFACVPAAKGGYNWFAAVSSTESAAAVALSTGSSDGAFYNYSRSATQVEKDVLYDRFCNDGNISIGDRRWHDPIPQLLEDTLRLHERDVSYCPAYASTGVHLGMNGIWTQSSDDGAVKGTTTTMPIAFVGDAFHTFDPILAIGGGVAIESSKVLYEELKKTSTNGDNTNCLQKALAEYERRMLPRFMRLDAISDTAQRFGHVESFLYNSYRDVFLQHLLPQKAKGKMMDALIRMVASG